MKDLINRLRTTRLGFLIILLILLWAKTEFAYYVDFTLGTSGLLQQIIQLINPLGLSALFLSLALYVKKARPAYITAIVIYLLMTVLVFVNVLYYREFTDFMSVQTMLGVSKVTQGLGTSTINMMIPRDLVYWFDVVLVLLAYLGYGIRNVWRYIHHESLVWPHFGLKVDTKDSW